MSLIPDSLLQTRRARLASEWCQLSTPIVVRAGEPVRKPGMFDQTYDERTHPHYYWLTGDERMGSVIVFDPAEGWLHFQPEVTATERLWCSVVEPVGKPISEFDAWLARQSGTVIELGGNEPTPAKREDFSDAELMILAARRPKDTWELEQMRAAVTATAEGYRRARAATDPGVSERQIAAHLESGFLLAGADGPGYHTIVGIGSNAAVLHFTPTDRAGRSGDVMLIDAGAARNRYTADVTRSWVIDGEWSGVLGDFAVAVRAALAHGSALCTAGTEWLHVHKSSAVKLAEGIVAAGLSRISAEELVESEAIALFFPHGVGHGVGLGVRDAGGVVREREREAKAAGAVVRADLTLQPGFIMTVEPGLYFVPALLQSSSRREKFANHLHWDRIDACFDLGGVRMEDNILVTEAGPMNLTAEIPP